MICLDLIETREAGNVSRCCCQEKERRLEAAITEVAEMKMGLVHEGLMQIGRCYSVGIAMGRGKIKKVGCG